MVGCGGSGAAVLGGILGLMMLLGPVDWLLKLDKAGHGAGYRLYSRAATPEKGRRKAMIFYRVMGAVLVGVAAIILWPS